MDQLKLLGVALGLASLAGINLYLTVFVTGLAIHQHWIVLGPAYQSLAILGQPIVIAISGTLYVLEFFADKIPWVDSIWDAIHTIIRPIGGALLAIRVLGQTSPAFDLAVALTAGGASLITHSAKASTRLVANASPEPFSNIALSLAEDVAVLGGLALIHYNPALALGVFVLLLALILYFGPKIFRAVKLKVWLVWKKLNRPAASDPRRSLAASLPARYAAALAKENLLGETIAWAVPCISKRLRGLPANCAGWLVATNEEPHKLVFLARRRWRTIAQRIDLEGYTAARQPKFLTDNLVLSATRAKAPDYTFLFERGRGEEVQEIVEHLNSRLAAAAAETVAAA